MTKKDDLPAMPFYVGDWLKAPDIQCLSYELKGLWFEMLCFMWESTERGFLVKANYHPYSIEELSRLLRLPEVLLEQKLKQLLEFAIYSVREKDGAIYSRRMVKDQKIREIRKKAGSLGGQSTFAQAKLQAKSQQMYEDENEDENVIINEEGLMVKITDEQMQTLWIKTFGKNPSYPEREETEKLIEKFGYEKVYATYRDAKLKNFKSLSTLINNLNENGDIKPLEKANGTSSSKSGGRGNVTKEEVESELSKAFNL